MSPQRVQRKPLELHVYPHWEDIGGRCYSDREGLDFPINVDYWIQCKRLNEDELAAEFHAQTQRHTMMCYDDVYLQYVENEEPVTTPQERREEFRRIKVLERFATHPDHDVPAP